MDNSDKDMNKISHWTHKLCIALMGYRVSVVNIVEKDDKVITQHIDSDA